MILARDGDFASAQVLDRWIAAPMAEFKFEGPPAERMPQHLLSQTDGKNRRLARELPHLPVNIVQGCRVTRTVGEEHTVRFFCQHLLCCGAGVDHVAGKTLLPQAAQDVELDPEIV